MTEVTTEVLEAYWEVKENPAGQIYRWHPECVCMDCPCGSTLALTKRLTGCHLCGRDYSDVVEREILGHKIGKTVVKPWRLEHDEAPLATPF